VKDLSPNPPRSWEQEAERRLFYAYPAMYNCVLCILYVYNIRPFYAYPNTPATEVCLLMDIREGE
jgi:hypothetical protein